MSLERRAAIDRPREMHQIRLKTNTCVLASKFRRVGLLQIDDDLRETALRHLRNALLASRHTEVVQTPCSRDLDRNT